ncbi:MAG TPA: formate dehydrogenase, partial [Methylophilus sp.]|nr:formate dehydrogenase [Methylophilus sp.]
MVKVYVPIDSTALSLGAERTAKKIIQEAQARGVDITLVRNGSRGLFWLEPLVEIETAQGRVAFGPVQPSDVLSLFEAGFTDALSDSARAHPLYLGLADELAWLKK